jgi:hypothetical protein
MRYHDQNGQDWSDIVDFLTLFPDASRRVVRLLAEIGASGLSEGANDEQQLGP